MTGKLVFWEDEYGIESVEKVFLNEQKAYEYADKRQCEANDAGKEKDYFVRDIEIVE